MGLPQNGWFIRDNPIPPSNDDGTSNSEDFQWEARPLLTWLSTDGLPVRQGLRA